MQALPLALAIRPAASFIDFGVSYLMYSPNTLFGLSLVHRAYSRPSQIPTLPKVGARITKGIERFIYLSLMLGTLIQPD
jgi:hypothetical protein